MKFAFSSIDSFFKMGNYTFEVWSSFAITLIALLALLVYVFMQNRSVEHKTRKQLQYIKSEEKS